MSTSSSSTGFPAGSSPENKLRVPSALCSFGMRPYIITGFLRHLFGQHFADPDNIENAFLRRTLESTGSWRSANGGSGGILIESATRWKPETTEQRPAIILKRNRWSWNSRLIDDRVMGDATPDQFDHYTGWWQGSHTIFPIADEGGAVEQLGLEVAKLVIQYRSVIRESLNLDRFTFVGIDEVMEIEEATENYTTPITVAYQGQENWRMTQNVPRLKRIEIKTSEVLGC